MACSVTRYPARLQHRVRLATIGDADDRAGATRHEHRVSIERDRFVLQLLQVVAGQDIRRMRFDGADCRCRPQRIACCCARD